MCASLFIAPSSQTKPGLLVVAAIYCSVQSQDEYQWFGYNTLIYILSMSYP